MAEFSPDALDNDTDRAIDQILQSARWGQASQREAETGHTEVSLVYGRDR